MNNAEEKVGQLQEKKKEIDQRTKQSEEDSASRNGCAVKK